MPAFELRKILGNSGWLMAERVATLVCGLAVSILVARHLGPAEFGRLSYLVALVGLAMPLTALGLGFVVTRAILDRPGKEATILRTALVLRLCGGIAGLGLLVAAHAIFAPREVTDRLLLAALGLSGVSHALLVYESWFNAHVKARLVAVPRVCALLAGAAVKVWLVVADRKVGAFVLAAALDYLLVAAAVSVAYRKHGQARYKGRFDPGEARILLRDAKWLLLSGLMAAVYLRIDVVMLRQMSSQYEAGVYSVAARISEAWFFVPAAIATSFFPSLMAARREGPAVYEAHLQRICDGLLMLAASVAVVVTLLATPLIRLVYGPAYADAAAILTMHVWGGIFISMRALLSKWLVVEELYRYSLLSHGLGAVVNVVLNLALIPGYGGMGAAAATVVSYATASYVVLFFSNETRAIGAVMTRSLLLPVGGRLPWRRSQQPRG